MSRALRNTRRRLLAVSGNSPRHAARGFTLVELLVALSAGLLVTAAAFALARNSMKSFQEESRIAASQVSATLGMSRLTADLQRAGYMASPNVADDPRICRGVTRADVPLQAMQLFDAGSDNSNGSTGLDDALMDYAGQNSGLQMPDVVVIAGNMTSAEQFEYRLVTETGTVHLAVDRGPMQRAFEDLGQDLSALERVFVPRLVDGGDGERFARIVEPSGKESYVVVTDAVATVDGGGALATVTLTVRDPSGGVPTNTGGADCGFVNRGTGLINPVSLVRYRVARLCDTVGDPNCTATFMPFAASVRATGPDAVMGESTRADLVREEILPQSATTPLDLSLTLANGALTGLATQEILAEFAVEFDLSVFHVGDNPLIPPGAAPSLVLAEGGDIDGLPGQRPRSLRIRMGTRARVPDREAPSPTGVTSRFELVTLPAESRVRWARMRTLHAEVQLPNIQAVTW